jgi:hypothetical protein
VLFSGSLAQTIGGLQQQAEPLAPTFPVTPATQILVVQVPTIVFQTLAARVQTTAHTVQLVVLAQHLMFTMPENMMHVALR